MTSRNIRVVLLDDHNLLREALRENLSRQVDIEVVADFGHPEDFLRAAPTLAVDILLLDITMPSLDGFQVASRIKKIRSDIKIIIMSMHDDEHSVRQALKLKVSGYVLKDAFTTDLLSAIRSASRNQLYLSPAIAKMVIEKPAQLDRLKENEFGLDLLTDREKDVLKLIAMGLRIKEVASQLHIATRTAETHKKNIMDKLDIHNAILLTRYAIQSNLVEINKR